MLDCIITIKGQRSRGLHSNVHLPVLDRTAPIREIYNLSYTGFQTPVLEHLKKCRKCDPNDIIIGMTNAVEGADSPRMMMSLLNHPGTERKIWLTAAHDIVKSSVVLMTRIVRSNEMSRDELIFLTSNQNNRRKPGIHVQVREEREHGGRSFRMSHVKFLHEALTDRYFPRTKDREWLTALSILRSKEYVISNATDVEAMIPIISVHEV